VACVGKTCESVAAVDRLRAGYRGNGTDRVATERLRTLRRSKDNEEDKGS
jgi:hypothetical protein